MWSGQVGGSRVTAVNRLLCVSKRTINVTSKRKIQILQRCIIENANSNGGPYWKLIEKSMIFISNY